MKAATTGEMPPNSQRGQSFINDPKIHGDSEVKGQIRLQFKGRNKKKMVIIRSFQLTQKGKKLEFKQLESALQTRDEKGEIQSHSYRCSDMDKLVPELMGVSKAILENVIFVHQEDVNWPLDESKVLKQKFDDIFASTRYTKALKEIKDFKKKQNDMIKNLTKDVAVFEIHQQNYKKFKKNLENTKKQVEELIVSISEMDVEIQKMDEKITSYEKIGDNLRKLRDKLTESNKEKELLHKSIDEIQKSLKKVYNVSDEEFQNIQKEFNEQLQTLKKERDEKQSLLKEYQTNQQKNNEELNKLNSKIGALNEAQRNFETKLAEAGDFIISASKKCDIHGYEAPFDPKKIENFSKELESKLKNFRDQLSKLKSENQRKDTELNDQINKINLQLTNNKNTTKTNNTKLTNVEKSIKDTTMYLENDAISEESLNKTKKQLDEVTEELEKKKSEYNFEENSLKIQKLKESVSNSNKRINEITKILKQREDEQLAAIKIKDLKDEKQKKENDVNEQISKVINEITSFYEEDINPDNFEKNLKEKIQKKEMNTNSKDKELISIEKNLSSFKDKISNCDEQIETNQKSIVEKEKKINTLCAGKNLFEILPLAEEQMNKLRDETSMIESLQKCYEKFMKIAKDQNLCPICERGLNHDQLSHFIETQQSKLSKTPDVIKDHRNKLKDLEKKVAQLRDLSPLVNEVENIKIKIIPGIQEKKQGFQTQYNELKSKFEENEKIVLSLKSEITNIKKYLDIASKITVLNSSLKEVTLKVKKEEEKLKSQSTHSISYEELHNEQEDLRKRSEQDNHQIEILRKEKEEKEKELNLLRTSLDKKKNEYHQSQLLFEKKKTKIEELKKLQLEKTELIKQNQENEKNLKPLEEELTIQKDLQIKSRKENEKKEVTLQTQIDEFQKQYVSLQSSLKDIKKYIEEQKGEQLEQTKEKIEKIKIKLTENQNSIKVYQKELNECLEKLNLENEIHREIEDNKRLRDKKKDLKKIEKSIEEVNQKLKDSTGVEEFNEKTLQKIQKEHLKISKIRSEKLGSKNNYLNEIKSVEQELKKEEFKDIDKNHKIALIKLKTCELANSDLDKYYNALNQALMKYHSMKMSEINDIIKELWQKTYRGHDIDTIEIRAEEGTGRSSYNYRVVMIKGDIALDMRGRCSAGQKVLACLIIRLALAEAFCIECGLLALDEPTTNLDHDNVTSLAQSLQIIINERRKQSNFQLIVITHDEDFVAKLGRSDYVDKYYRISKDPETQTSRIDEQNFTENRN